MDGKIQWHPAFYSALKIELKDDADALIFKEEHLLSKKPMQIDILVIKKTKEHCIKKKIGHFFRKYNLFEYKSPEDTLSINDFYKIFGYACFYQADTKNIMEIHPETITVTLACSHYPRKMLKHIRQRFNMVPRQYAPGIYYLSGGIFPIQLLITKDLAPDEYYWLQHLRKDLKSGGEIRRLIEHYDPHKNSQLYQSVMNVILQANHKEAEVERKMCEALRELFAEDIRESQERGHQEGLQQGWIQMKQVLSLHASGLSTDEIARQMDLPLSTIEKMLSI